MNDRERCAALYLSDVTDTRELARRFGRSDRQICRWLLAEGVRDPRRRPEIPAIVEALLREGMPAAYVAAEFPAIAYTTILERARRIPGHAAAVSEWRRAWARIAADPELLALHWEFAPPTIRSQKADRVLSQIAA